ncbi:MAG: DUF4256 domain-containing protein [Candidatus Gracilibacteria bacterium]|jgi:hypothetical protein
MELNQLPEGYDEAKSGPQKRKTFDDFPGGGQAKAAYDAANLIAMAKKSLQRSGIEDPSQAQILTTIEAMVNAHRGDMNDALRAAIAEEQRAVNPVADVPAPTDESQNRELTPERVEEVIQLLKTRREAEENRKLCPQLDWSRAEKALRATPEALWTVDIAEKNGHEPTIYFSDKKGFDIGTLAKEPPLSTRDCVYDKNAEIFKKRNYPDEKFNENAKDQAEAMGWGLMGVKQGNHIAANTASYTEAGWRWYKTGADIRKTGRALLGPRVGGDLSVYPYLAGHHGSYNGWGGSLRVNFVD